MIWCDGPSPTVEDTATARGRSSVVRDMAALVAHHRDWINAGAERVHSATLLAHTVTPAVMRAWHASAVECVREAGAPETWGTVGPVDTIARLWWPVLESLLEHEPDGVQCSTLYSRAHVSAAFEALRDVVLSSGVDVPIVVSVSVSPSHGVESWRWITELSPPDGVTLGLNCCEGVADLGPVVDAMCTTFGAVHVAPSAGLPQADGRYPTSASAWAGEVGAWCERYELASIGACCGCTPEYLERGIAAVPR